MNWKDYLASRLAATLPLAKTDYIPIYQGDNEVHKLLLSDFAAGSQNGRNLLIGWNLSANPLQRGSASMVMTNGGFAADRIRVEFDGAATITRDIVDVAVGSKVLGVTIRKGLKLTVTNKSAATFIRVGERIESVTRLAGDTAAFSSAIQGNKALAVPVRVVQCFGAGGAPSANVITPAVQQLAVNANLQELYTDIAVPSIAGKTYGTTAGTDYLELQYDLSNLATGDYVIIPLSQLERSPYPSLFDVRDAGAVLQACQRFFAKTFAQGVTPAQNAGPIGALYGVSASGASIMCNWKLPVTMRALPTTTYFSTDNASNNWTNGAGTHTAPAQQSTSDSNIMISSGATTAGNYFIHAIADAEFA
jgi:hypothetical protein